MTYQPNRNSRGEIEMTRKHNWAYLIRCYAYCRDCGEFGEFGKLGEITPLFEGEA